MYESIAVTLSPTQIKEVIKASVLANFPKHNVIDVKNMANGSMIVEIRPLPVSYSEK